MWKKKNVISSSNPGLFSVFITTYSWQTNLGIPRTTEMFFGKYIIYIRGTYQNIDELKLLENWKKEPKLKQGWKQQLERLV